MIPCSADLHCVKKNSKGIGVVLAVAVPGPRCPGIWRSFRRPCGRRYRRTTTPVRHCHSENKSMLTRARRTCAVETSAQYCQRHPLVRYVDSEKKWRLTRARRTCAVETSAHTWQTAFPSNDCTCVRLSSSDPAWGTFNGGKN